MEYQNQIKEYLEREINVLRSLDVDAINRAMNTLMECRDRGADIYICGNGGSASTASHYACDFNKGLSEALGGQKFRFHCLSDNVPTMMAIANDYCYEDIFIRQLMGKLRSEDIVIGISGSGNSENVVRALDFAKKTGSITIGITGYTGGKVMGLSDISLHADIYDMQIAEDVHMVLDHLMMSVLCACKGAQG